MRPVDSWSSSSGLFSGLSVSFLLADFGLSPSVALSFDEEDFDVVCEAVDECDGAGCVGKYGVPVL